MLLGGRNRKIHMRLAIVFFCLVPLTQVSAWVPTQQPMHRRRQRTITCIQPQDDPVDEFVLKGDAAALLGYGCVQSLTDFLLSPLAASQPDAFSNDVPVDAPVAQACLLVLTWVSTARAVGGYNPKVTRALPDTLVGAVTPWLVSSAIICGSCGLLSQVGIGPGLSGAEVDFVLGSATVVGGWRLVSARALPPF